MFVLGLLVLAAAAVASVELVLANRGPMDFHMWNWTWHFDAFWLAVIGAIIVTAAWVGLGLMQIAFAHSRRIRREHRELAEENRMLAERVGTTDNVEPMPPEPPVAERRVAGEPVGGTATAVPADSTYDNPTGQNPTGQNPTGQHAMSGDSEYAAGEAEHHGFFSRHAMSGRRDRQ
jgi:hypothetical protein